MVNVNRQQNVVVNKIVYSVSFIVCVCVLDFGPAHAFCQRAHTS